MQIENLQLVTALIIILGILMLLQAALLLVTLSQINQLLKRLRRLVEPASHTAEALLSELEQLLDKLDPLKEKLPLWVARTETTLISLRQSVGRADEAAGRGLGYLRVQVRKTDQAMDRLLDSFSQQSYRVHRAVLNPAIHVSALVKAAKATLHRLFSKNRDNSPASNYPDQEIFI